MRKIINSTYISLDGVIEGPHLWPSLGRDGDDRAGQIQTDLLLSCDAVLMGRRTYDGFAPVWPTRSGDPYSDRIIVQYGYGAVSRLMLEHGLLDELRLWVHPLIVGAGRPSVILNDQTDKQLQRAA
jgi:dihydrofolate reductase